MQRQLRLGDTLDDYCPRERRVTNHAIVAMIGPDVKQTRCTTCDTEHEYKQAKVPRQRRKTETPAALYATVLAGGPKRVTRGQDQSDETEGDEDTADAEAHPAASETPEGIRANGPGLTASENAPAPPEDEAIRPLEPAADEEDDDRSEEADEEGPVHRPLIRASLPRIEGQAPPARPAPDFTIRQPSGRPTRFRPRHQRGGPPFQGPSSRTDGMGGASRGGPPRHGAGRPPQGGNQPSHLARRNGPGRKRSK
jgi:hypothetical protein